MADCEWQRANGNEGNRWQVVTRYLPCAVRYPLFAICCGRDYSTMKRRKLARRLKVMISLRISYGFAPFLFARTFYNQSSA
jgi:hypothetical protein